MLKVLSLCDGKASGLEALKQLGIDCEYWAVEICDKKRAVADARHPDIFRGFNDVYELSKEPTMDYFDLFLAGPTCTSLSSQGKREEWDGESKIFFACADILNKCRERNPDIKFFFENVASMTNKCREDISQVLGVSHWLGESKYVSAQDRKRYYWFNWQAPDLSLLGPGPTFDSILDEDGLCGIAFSKSNRNKPGEAKKVEGRIKTIPKANTLTTGRGGAGQSTKNFVITKDMKVRGLSVAECARLQGAQGYDFSAWSEDLAYKCLGDSWNIPTIVEILRAGQFRAEDLL